MRLGWALALLGAGATIGWGAAVLLRVPPDPLASNEQTFATAQLGEVSSDLTLNAAAAWTLIPTGVNRAVGVVTSVGVTPGDEVNVGSVLYSVGLRPVVAARGSVPSFREIGRGATGEDVTQLQRFLAEAGYLHGTPDGTAGAETVEAIRDWQDAQGLARTGVVEPGDIVYLPDLPARVVMDEGAVALGSSVVGGELVVSVAPASPEFTVAVTEGQAAMIPRGSPVQITSPTGSSWRAVTGEVHDGESEPELRLILEAEGNEAVCESTCASIPMAGSTLLPARITLVAPVSGVVVPSSALVTLADGQTAVIDDTGTKVPVTLIASARGMSVVDGLAVDQRVRVPAQGG